MIRCIMDNPAVTRDDLTDQIGITRRLGLKQVGISRPSDVVDTSYTNRRHAPLRTLVRRY